MKDALYSRRNLLTAGAGSAAWLALKPAFADTQDLAGMSLKKAGDLLRRKATSPVELTQACLQRIEKYNPALNAFITVTGEQALATAREMEAEQHKGKWRGPLHGIPIALKDNIDTAGVLTTAASELFKDRIPTEDAEVVRRLKAAGAIILGKLNLHEFAFGITSAISHYGPVHNPWALDRVPGGSSGGSGAATAADLCFGALGTDTGGSIRIPASFCGVVGLKPTYGRVSVRGVIPLSWSLDHVGPLSKTAEDAALMLNVLAGYDEADILSIDAPIADYAHALKMPVSKLRLGMPRAGFFDNLDPDVQKAMDAAIVILRGLTARVSDVQLPPSNMPSLLACEEYAYHAKWFAESPEKYQPDTRGRLQRSADLKAEPYVRSRHEVDQLRKDIKKSFRNVDLVITPTMPNPPVTIENATAPNPAGTRNTAPFDVYGLPTISIPCGFTTAGLPIGLQISGAPFAETAVLALAHAYEQATEWHTRRPPLKTS